MTLSALRVERADGVCYGAAAFNISFSILWKKLSMSFVTTILPGALVVLCCLIGNK